MGYSVRILPTAEEELNEIVGYLVRVSPSAARRFLAAYERKLSLLRSGTIEFGLSPLPELASMGYRACGVGSYVLLYYRDNDCAVIAHIFHHSRNYARLVVPPRDANEGEETPKM